MKKGSIIGIIILIIIIGIRLFLKRDYANDYYEEEILIGEIQENIENEFDSQKEGTGELLVEEQTIQETEEHQIEEKIPQEEIIFPDNYPLYGIIENDYGEDESYQEDENNEDFQETEKLLRQALEEFSQENEIQE